MCWGKKRKLEKLDVKIQTYEKSVQKKSELLKKADKMSEKLYVFH